MTVVVESLWWHIVG